MIKIIGIDPGLAATGIGIINGTGSKISSYSYGSINTSKDNSLQNRLNQIFSKLHLVLEEEKPDLMVVEDIFSLEKYPKSGILLGKVSGVILLAGCKINVQAIEIPVREAKRSLTGNGNASKAQLEIAVRNLINKKDPIKPYHASDAMALALIGLYRYNNFLSHKSGVSHDGVI